MSVILNNSRRLLVCVSFWVMMLFLLFACISYALPTVKTFDLTINSKTITVILPGIFPKMDTAIFAGEQCFDANFCVQRFCLNPMPGHDHVDFLYTDKGEVIVLVWTRTLQGDYIFWKYIDGVPILTDLEDIKRILKDRVKPLTAILFRK